MDFKKDNQHMVDVLFVLTLFFVFALSALTLVILGANVYRNTVNNMDTNFNDRTSYAYITQKLRQNDQSDALSVATFGGHNACLITENINDTVYNTYIYEYEGYLCELLARADMDMEPSAGTRILELSEFDISQIGPKLYALNIVTASDNKIDLYINCHSDSEVSSYE